MSVQFAAEKSSSTMRAWTLAAPGDVANLTQSNVEILTPGPTQVRVKIVAATLNPVDWKHAHFEGMSTFPAVFGVDGAGVIDALGSEVKTNATGKALQRGSRVHFFNNVFAPWGSWADYCIVEAAAVVVMPDSMSFATAAVSPCAAWTAYEALYDRLKIEAGKTIFIAAGAGGVGHFAVQMAHNSGLKVIASASGENVERIKASGLCALVIDYKTQNIKDEIMKFTNNVGVDYAFDMLGADEAKVSLASLRFGGALCHIAISVPELPGSADFFNALTIHHVFIPGNLLRPDALVKFVGIGEKTNELFVSGKLKEDISKTVTFDQVGAAALEQKGGRVRGKILIAVGASEEEVRDPNFKPAL
jgi:NADPH2:quinone reductase